MRTALLMPLALFACRKDTPATESPADSAGPEVLVVESGIIPCEDPNIRETLGPFVPRGVSDGWPLAEAEDPIQAWGLVVADFDGDGWPDVFVPGQPGPSRLLMGGEGGFVDETEARMPDPLDLANGASAADVDGDGDLDLWVGLAHDHDRILMNDGAGVFDDKTPAAMVSHIALLASGGSWADADGDDDLDLFVYTAAGPPACERGVWQDLADGNTLWGNLGEFSFSDESVRLPPALLAGYTQAGGWHDIDGDLDPDLLTVNDYGPLLSGNAVALNHNATFSQPAETGLEVAAFGMGLAVGELNGDGTPDFLVSDWDRMELLLSDGSGGWYDAASSLRLGSFTLERHAAWSGSFGDIDLDGDLDIFAAFGPVPGPESAPEDDCLSAFPLNSADQPDALWIATPDGYFESARESAVADIGNNRGSLFADLNRDGNLDLLVRSLDGRTLLYTARCDAAAWLEIDLRQPGGNPYAVGARVQIGAQTRWVEIGGTTINGSAPTTLHFGMGEAETADITVTWPDGEESVVSGVSTRQILRIERQ